VFDFFFFYFFFFKQCDMPIVGGFRNRQKNTSAKTAESAQ